MRRKVTVLEFVAKNWLLLGILLCIVFASVFPKLGSKGGPLKPEYTVKYGAVSLIFLISGLTLKTDSIFHTFKQYRLHLFIQLFTFVLIPLYAQLVVKVLAFFGVNGWILRGFITVACMPPPVSSAVILTRAANGNETAAIFNSVLGSFLGIILTPISLLINLGFTTVVPLMGTVVQLITTVLGPLMLGQAIRNCTSFRGHTLPLGTVSQLALIVVIFTTFCDTFETPEMGLTASDILITVFFVLMMQISLLWVSFHLGKYNKKYFEPSDTIAIVFCSTHKSLTLGIPILRIMFHGFSHLSQISLPLLVYHPTQIILGGMVVSHLKEWGQKHRRPPV
ncbi:PREDICTED: sodium/bile acid cotransporter 7-like [Nicrophorus vespilloides]|uniref:Sodium/bile acid cotransporter 7-like n=1 Tax=Nicrophorus vespilloides TaxID=110193 RepID=A0ABM1M6T6_NICVS|nr:PREDICTED: sodium/bile acid cotransporter 7-like [Nicrophorus vespilloides]